ncbi:hypothetical protein [Neobacillus sp. D3-1R]|uniref:hypothetical protein n=1 Tax=Neobacillus sp. D3-1R TaxID=3445778 RepID=UPI003F9F3E8F
MVKMISVKKAHEEIKRLQAFIDLAESYEADTLQKLIIKEYAFTNSIAEVTRILHRRGITANGETIEHQDVAAVIKGKAADQLHRLVKSGYKSKIKQSRGR